MADDADDAADDAAEDALDEAAEAAEVADEAAEDALDEAAAAVPVDEEPVVLAPELAGHEAVSGTVTPELDPPGFVSVDQTDMESRPRGTYEEQNPVANLAVARRFDQRWHHLPNDDRSHTGLVRGVAGFGDTARDIAQEILVGADAFSIEGLAAGNGDRGAHASMLMCSEKKKAVSPGRRRRRGANSFGGP